MASVFFNEEQGLLKTAAPILNREEHVFDNDGTLVILQTTKLPLYDSLQNIMGLVGIGHVITEQKKG